MPFEVIVKGDPPYTLRCMACGKEDVTLPSDCVGNRCCKEEVDAEECESEETME